MNSKATMELNGDDAAFARKVRTTSYTKDADDVQQNKDASVRVK
jgi:hypothetical protein